MALTLSLIIAAAVIVLDQITKIVIVKAAQGAVGWSITLIPGFFKITYLQNTGMAWSLLSGKQFFLELSAAVAIGLMLWYLMKGKADRLTALGLSLMIGGAAGNLIDRIVLNYVRDFLDFYIFGYNFPVFNVADSALCIGVGLLMLATIFEEKRENHEA